MTTSQTSVQNESSINEPPLIGRLDLILEDILGFNPMIYSDDELWNLLCQKDYSTKHPFHCLIVRFGAIREVTKAAPYSHQTTKKIEIFYKGKMALRNVSEFCYALTSAGSKKFGSRIITPWYFHDYSTYLNFDNIASFLENKTLLLLYSITGKNKYNKNVSAWTLVELKDNLEDNAKILREYCLKIRNFAIYSLKTAPNTFFNFDVPESIKTNMLTPLDDMTMDCYYKNQSGYIAKTIGPKRMSKTISKPSRNTYDDLEYYDEPSSSEDSYLDDELDYIRQNGGDWIDD
ncbi:MAG: hypothetical protein K2N34_01845 [Lachnospiraceae bacterium]|nr:hypothetical protein [Lachnospiraceae bacterium]